MDLRVYHGSGQLLGIVVDATTIEGTATVVDTYPVAVAILPTADDGPTTLDYVPAAWVIGPLGPFVTVMVGPGSAVGTLTPGHYYMWVRITASPEVPVLRCPDRLVIY